MAKAKTNETVILIRIPDVNARQGEGSLTIQRGNLGHLHQFHYSGLTLRGHLTEAVQNALLELAKLEASPPPPFNTADTPTTEVTDDTPTDDPDAEVEVDDQDEEPLTEDTPDGVDNPTPVMNLTPPDNVPASASPTVKHTRRTPPAQIALF